MKKMKINNQERNKMSTNREALIYWLRERSMWDGMIKLIDAANTLKADAERIAGYKEDQRELMSQMQAQQQEINELKANQVHMLEANAREIESIECDYTDQVLRAIEAEEKLAQQVAGFQCHPQPAVTEDGFCEWVCPMPVGYLMQCCDCGLIHEVETRVVKYDPRPSENFIAMDDPDLQVQLRMKRRDDLAPKGAKP